MSDWDYEENPISAKANFYLRVFKEEGCSVGNPVEDLTEMMLDCYEILSTISERYKPSGDTKRDKSVSRVKGLLRSWPSDGIDDFREMVVLDKRRPSMPPPPLPSVFEKPTSIVGEPIVRKSENDIVQSAALTNTDTPAMRDKAKSSPPPPPRPPPPPSPPPSRKSDDDSTSTITKSSSNSSLSSKSKNTSLNDEYFLKLKEDEALAKKKQEEQEAKMKPEELKKLQEERRMAEEHNNNKTAHYSKLGARYVPGKKKTATGEIIMDRGSGGRGRGRGRGN